MRANLVDDAGMCQNMSHDSRSDAEKLKNDINENKSGLFVPLLCSFFHTSLFRWFEMVGV